MIYTQKDYAVFIDAMKAGKTVEVFYSREWWEVTTPVFNFPPYMYRVVENE